MLGINKLLLMVFLLGAVSACPDKKKTAVTGSAKCETISNASWVADNCVCVDRYQKHVQEDGSMRCDLISQNNSCLGNSKLVGTQCQCIDSTQTYNASSSTPCGGGVIGLGVQQLQQACNTVGSPAQWNQAGFCHCGLGQQFNYFTKRCEPLTFHHLQQWNAPGATFYGAGGQGIYTCQGNAMFHPAFGGCRDLTSDLVTSVCTDIYGGTMQGANCLCPNGGHWYKGSCFNLDHDFFTNVRPALPPAVSCGLKGQRLVGSECQQGIFGGGGGSWGRPIKPVVCDRVSAVGNGQFERVILYPDRVEVETHFPPHLHTYRPQDYFRERCEHYALDRGRWVRGFGIYDPSGSPQYFGECACREGFHSYRDPDLFYQYCVAPGSSPVQYHGCKWRWQKDLRFNVGYDPNAGGFIGEACLNNAGDEYCVIKRWNPR